MERGTNVTQVPLSLIDDFSKPDVVHYAINARDDDWIKLLVSRPAQQLVQNVRTRWALLQVGDVSMPITINETDYDNSYVCSPYTGCVSYPKTEVKKLDSVFVRWFVLALVHAMGPPLRVSHINRTVCINNWLLSTNLYPQLDHAFVPELTQLLTMRFPDHAIAFRSLNDVSNHALLKQLGRDGYLLAPSRQVYFFDGASGAYLRKQNNVWDKRLLENTGYRVVQHGELRADDAVRIEQLYRMLYVDKYSPHNPQFTAHMMNEYRARRLLTMWGLRDRSGRLDGIVGAFEREGVMTVPIVGYDTSLPKQLGLYRLLMSIVLQEAANRKLRLNLSSGASHFKRLRGGTPCIEFTAVYCRHLSFSRRFAWHALTGLMRNVGAPILQRYLL